MASASNSLGPREKKRAFAAMSACYFLGTFNDNFYKQAVLLAAVTSGSREYQGYAIMAFTLPFVVFAWLAGWFSDRFSKRTVVIAAKWLELAAMIFGALGMLYSSWPMMFAMLIVMGTQAAVFSPAINGSIPELFSGDSVVKANGIFRMAVMSAILLGSGLSGFVLDIHLPDIAGFHSGALLLSVVIISVALVGILSAYALNRHPAADPEKPFPFTGPVETLQTLAGIRCDKLLSLVIILDVFIWLAGSLQILFINPMGIDQFHFSKTGTSLLIVAQLVGIGGGGLLSSRFARGEQWYRVLVPASFGMGVFMCAVGAVPYLPAFLSASVLYVSVGAVGFFGGLFMVPLESFIQIRPSPDKKGTVWASANFIIFTGILLSGPLGNLLNSHFLPTQGFAMLGALSVVISIILSAVFKRGVV